MNEHSPTRWSITSAADLLAAVPYLLGFHPDDGEAVWIALQGQRFQWMGGADLPEPGTDPDQIRSMVTAALTATCDHGATSIMVIGYGPAERVTPLVDAIRSMAPQVGIGVEDLLRVTDGRFYSYQCTDPTCCPPEGRIIDAATSPIAAQATLEGRAALPNRHQYLAQVAPITGAAQAAMAAASNRAHQRLAHALDTERATPIDTLITTLGQTALDTALADPRRWPLSVDDAAWLILLLTDDDVRDLAWDRTKDHPEHLSLWMDLTRRAEADLVGNTAGICALCAFEQGKASLGQAALDRIVQDHPTHPLAAVVAAGIDDLIPGGAGVQRRPPNPTA